MAYRCTSASRSLAQAPGAVAGERLLWFLLGRLGEEHGPTHFDSRPVSRLSEIFGKKVRASLRNCVGTRTNLDPNGGLSDTMSCTDDVAFRAGLAVDPFASIALIPGLWKPDIRMMMMEVEYNDHSDP